jgi:hypothetical protein
MPVPVPDRRSNLVLRALVDDMLDRLRRLNRDAGGLTVTERERAEADLEGVMSHVRRIAAQGSGVRSNESVSA